MKIKRNSRSGGVTLDLAPHDEQLLEQGLKAASQAASPFHLRTLVLPVDFSDHAAKAVAYAQAFAGQFGAQVILVHVVEPAVVPDNFGIVPPSYEEMNGLMRQAAQQRLGQLALEVAGQTIAVRPVVCTGRAPREILRVARETEADLIIIATHGHTGLKHVLLGSTAEWVVRHAPCPVLTVRQVEHDFVTVR